jgi:hypothetical protein
VSFDNPIYLCATCCCVFPSVFLVCPSGSNKFKFRLLILFWGLGEFLVFSTCSNCMCCVAVGATYLLSSTNFYVQSGATYSFISFRSVSCLYIAPLVKSVYKLYLTVFVLGT